MKPFILNASYVRAGDYFGDKFYVDNTHPQAQINLKNFRFEILDSSHILLVGAGSYLLKLGLKKGGTVDTMELVPVPEFMDQTLSFVLNRNRISLNVLSKPSHTL